MRYAEFKPTGADRSIVQCYWTLEYDGTGIGSVQRIVPDGCPELIVNLARPFQRRDADGTWRTQPQCFLAGQITGPLFVRPAGPAKILAARFLPYGLGQLLGVPMHPLNDCTPPFAIEGVTDLDSLRAVMVQKSAALGPVDAIVAEAAARCMADHPAISVRQLERRFLRLTGLTPKKFIRMRRFQKVFEVYEATGNWMRTAVDCGYYDQSHLIRDFQEFAGEPPRALLKDGELSRFFLSHFSRTDTATVR